MNKIQIASLAFKLAGIFSVVQAIPILQHITEFIAFRSTVMQINPSEGNPDFLLLGIVLTISLLIILGLTLIFFSGSIAKKCFGDDIVQFTPETELSAKNIHSMAISIVGVILFVTAIPKLIQVGVNIQMLANAGDRNPTDNIAIGTWAYSIGMATQMLVGVLLFLGAKGLSSLWYFLQKARPMSEINMRT